MSADYHHDDIPNMIQDEHLRASYIRGGENANRNKYLDRRKQEKDRKAAASQKPILKPTRQPDGSELDNSHRRSEQHDRGLSSKTRPAQQNPQRTSNAAHAKQTLTCRDNPHSSSEDDEDEDSVPPIAIKQTSDTAHRHTHKTTEDDEEAQTGDATSARVTPQKLTTSTYQATSSRTPTLTESHLGPLRPHKNR